MRLSTIVYLYRVRMRARLVQELLAVAGIAVGVALLFASQVANTSLTGSVTRLTNGLVGSARLQLAARDPQGFDEGLLSKVEQLRGVRSAVPVLQRGAYVKGPHGEKSVDLIGLDAGFVRLQGRLLSHVSATQLPRQQGVALPAPVARGIGAGPLEPLSIDVGDTSMRTLTAVILQASDIGELVDSRVAIAPLGLAQGLAGMRGRVSRILVEPQPGRDREVERELMRVAAGRLNVLPANFEAAIFSQAEAPTAQSTQMFSAISALVGFLFAFNAMLLTVPQRRNLIADLRLDGYTPVEILEVMLFDVFALGAVGIACGLALGEMLSRSLLQADPGYLSLAFPVQSLHIVSWQNVVVAAAGGFVAAVVGVMVPLRHEIFRNDQVGPHRARRPKRANFVAALSAGVGCIALTTAILIHGINAVGAAIIAFASLMLGLLLVMPAVFGGVVSLINRAQRSVMGVSSRIAIIEIMSSTTRSRSLAIAATGAIAVFGCVAIEGARSDLSTGLSRAASDVSLGTDLWVSPMGSATTLATTPFKNSYGEVLKMLPIIRSVGAYRGGFLDLADRRVLVTAPPMTDAFLLPPSQVIRGDPTIARSRLLRGGWIAVSRTLADERKLGVGGSMVLESPVPTRFRVAAIVTNLGWAPGAIIMNPDDYARAWGSGDVSAYQVMLQGGVPVSTGMREVQAALRSRSDLVVQTAERHRQNDISAQREGLARLTQIAALVLIAAALAMAAAMGAMIWQRRPRLAGMKVDGFSQGELWRALLWETALLLGVGCSIGSLFGLYGQLVLSHALVSVTGFPVVFSVAIPVAIVSLAIVATIALVMVAVPGYFAAQVKPALQDK